jgi:organic hydroperoxide reductase OsmC/OhrA
MGLAARKMKITLPADLAIDAEVDLCLTDGACFLQARLNVSLPSLEREVAQTLISATPRLVCRVAAWCSLLRLPRSRARLETIVPQRV